MKEGKLRRRLIIFVILAAVSLFGAIASTISYARTCDNYMCFQQAMGECKKVTYVNDDADATWGYEIKGKDSGYCVVEVTLLQAKEGELGIRALEGLSMDCSYPKGIIAVPQSDLSRCHGRLKEEMQSVIIEKLHTYVLENLGKIDNKLNSVLR